MGWSGGVYTKGNSATGGWTGDAASGIGIEAGRHDTQDNDFATGINTCLTKDGQNTPTANLPMGGFKHTGVANGSANTDYMAYGQIRNGTPLYMDTTNNRLGIGTTTPTEQLSILGGASASGAISLRGNNVAAANELLVSQSTDGATAYVYNRANGPMIFGTNNTERVRVLAGGNVGIGQNTPTSLLHVGSGASQTVVYVQGSTSGTGGGSAFSMPQGVLGNISAVDGGAYNAGMKLRSYGGGLTLTADSGGFAITGLAGSTGGSAMKVATATGQWFYDTSAQRYKENIRDSNYGLQTVLALQPRQYNYIFDGKPEDVGFIAEEVEPILPFLVAKNKDGQCESITYDRFTSILVKAVQELNSKIEVLEARIAKLEK